MNAIPKGLTMKDLIKWLKGLHEGSTWTLSWESTGNSKVMKIQITIFGSPK